LLAGVSFWLASVAWAAPAWSLPADGLQQFGIGFDVTITIYPGMSHDFALLMPDLQDSVKSFAEIRDFVKRHLHK